VIATFAGQPDGGLITFPHPNTAANRASIIILAARHRLPAIYPFRYFATEGGLMSYGIDQIDQWRGAATYVDRILRGEKPGDLPVQAPTKFELVINLKTAKAIGLHIPPAFPLRADEVIE
jgi:putative ABC transport system substrate-binding protein